MTPDFTRYLFANVGRLLGSLIGPPEKGATAEAAERPGGQKRKLMDDQQAGFLINSSHRLYFRVFTEKWRESVIIEALFG